MNKVCIVIPIYKEFPTDWERASFCQALKVLARYDIIIYTHKELNLAVYHNLARQYNKDFKVEYFDKNYFSSVIGYNRLCLTVDFYKRVSTYEYMLIYQLDAWVFRDELECWCNKGYDYIGAPWFENWGAYEDGNELWRLGNGGFSLRKIVFHIKFLSTNLPVSFQIDIKHGMKSFIKSCLKSVGIRNTVQFYVQHVYKRVNEDYFFTTYMCSISNRKTFIPRMPTILDAMKFSFESSPSYCYKLCGNKLPFGCHAYEKYQYESFWSKYIVK